MDSMIRVKIENRKRPLHLACQTAVLIFALACACRADRKTMMGDNLGRPPKDWWQAMRDYHGHVGPWNVLGYRIGRRALQEFGEQWGAHTLDITCHTPLRTPYTCMADGLVVGTGNTIGRLDIRLAEVADRAAIRVAIRRIADGKTLVFAPHDTFLAKIEKVTPDTLDALAHECAALPDELLFTIQ